MAVSLCHVTLPLGVTELFGVSASQATGINGKLTFTPEIHDVVGYGGGLGIPKRYDSFIKDGQWVDPDGNPGLWLARPDSTDYTFVYSAKVVLDYRTGGENLVKDFHIAVPAAGEAVLTEILAVPGPPSTFITKGDTGPAPSITNGTIATGAPSSSVALTFTETSPGVYRADGSVPQGQPGNDGAPGGSDSETATRIQSGPLTIAALDEGYAKSKVDNRGLARVFNVRDFGAVGDGIADDTASIQAAADAAAAVGGAVYLPTGTYKVTAPIVITNGIRIYGDDRRSSIIQSSTSDVLSLGGPHYNMHDLGVKSLTGGGHVVVVPPGGSGGSLAQSLFSMCEFNQANNGKSVWYFADPTSLGGGMFDCHWSDVLFQHKTTATVPAFYSVGTVGTSFAANRFTRCRAHSSGTFFFDIQTTATGAFNYNNAWDSINFEICDGGGIRIMSGLNNGINNVGFFDNNTIAGDLIYFGRVGSSSQSRGNSVRNYHRSGGTLSGAVDIRVAAGGNNGTTSLSVINGPTGAGITVDAGSGSGYVVLTDYDPSTVTVQNLNTARTVAITSDNGVQTPKLTIGAVNYFNGTGEPEGVVTATAGSIYSRTSGAATGRLYVMESSAGGNTGWKPVSDATRTTAGFAALTDTINTAGKYAGRMVFNTTTNRPVWASGAAASSAWVFADGTTAHTPA